MQISKYIMSFFMVLFWALSAQAMSIKLDGTGGLSSGTDCQTGAIYRFGTENSYNGEALDLLVKVINADNDYNEGTSSCTYVKDKTLATNLRDTDAGDNVAFEEYEITLVKKGTNTPVEVDRIMLTGYDLDINAGGGTDTDDFYVAADGAYISSGSAVTHTSGTFYGIYTDKMKGWSGDNCDDTAATPDATCRASSIWINGSAKNKISTIKVRVQNDNAYGEYTGDSYAYRLIQLSFQIEDFSALFNGQQDHGDAPSSYGEASGALDGTIMLGAGLPGDSESSYNGDSTALLDDNSAMADEDGVTLASSNTSLSHATFNANETVSLDVTTYGSGYLQLWADFNGDGDFEDSGEHIVDSLLVTNQGESSDGHTTNTNASSGVSKSTISFTVPASVNAGNSFIRVRFSEGNSASEKDPRSALSLRGEVEDYAISFTTKGTITGSVKDTNNNPIQGVTITLTQGTATISTTTTNTSGQYSFSDVDAGEYTLLESDKSGYSSVSDGDSSDDGDTTANSNTNDNAIPLTLTSGEVDSDNVFIDSPATGSISGSVKDHLNQNLPNATLTLYLSDGSTIAHDNNNAPIPSVTTDATGTFAFNNVPAGTYLIKEVNPTHYISISDDAGDDANTEDSLTDDIIAVNLAAGESDADNIFVDKLASGRVLGSVKDTTGQAIAGVTIMITDGTNTISDINGNPLSTTTDTSGNYTFNAVPTGDYFIVESDKAGYTSHADADTSADGDTTANTNTNDNTIPLTLTNNEVDSDNNFIDIPPHATIKGSVKDDHNQPLTSIMITVQDSSGNIIKDIFNNPLTTYTDSAGNYTFTDVVLGDFFIVESDKTGYSSISDTDSSDDADTQSNSNTNDNRIPITLTAGEIDADNIFIDHLDAGEITGLVKNSANLPLSGAKIKLVKADGSDATDTTGANLSVITTDATGTFSFLNLPAGNYHILEVDPSGYHSKSDGAGDDEANNHDSNDNMIPVSLSANESDTDNIFIDEGYKSISGKVLADIDGNMIGDKGIENVTVKISACQTNTFVSTTTANDGSFHFNNLIEGCYRLTEIDPEGYSSLKDMDSVNDNNITVGVHDQNITGQLFVDTPSLTISGKVLADMNFDSVATEPLEGVEIALYSYLNELIQTVTTNLHGAYQFDHLTPGSYTIREIDLKGYSSLRDSDGNNPNSISIELSETDLLNQNFEDQKRITISGVVKVDIDGDNIVDEPLQNALLVICHAADPCSSENNIASVITDTNGSYTFTGLERGDYKIIEIDKPGYDSIGDVDGANDNTIKVHLTGNGDVTGQDFDNKAIAPRFIVLHKSAGKKEAHIGDFVPYTITVENINNSYNYNAIMIEDTLPAGFSYEKGSLRLLRGDRSSTLPASGSDVIHFGSFALAAHEKVTLTYLLKVGVGVARGDHINSATAMQHGDIISNTATASVMVRADSFIDNALVIGKVFEDKNKNGIQDKDERGIAGVRLATVSGMLIETDGYGRYHIADNDSGGFGGRGKNVIVKVDKTTLPVGASLTTENPRVYRLSASGLNVINFGVYLPKQKRFAKERKFEKITMKEREVEVTKTITLGSIYFDSDQDCIRPDQIKALCAIADKIKQYGHGAIMIEGNTDARAPLWYNKKLAYKRAKSVYRELQHYLGKSIKIVDVIYDDCGKEVTFNPKYDWWGKPNIPRSKKECSEFGIAKKDCQRLLERKKGGNL